MARVLLVEDDALCRAELADLLAERGYEVDQARGGAEALEWLARAPEPPALILLDLRSPSMDGWSFREAQLAEVRFRQIPVVLLSGDPDLRRHAHTLGAAGWLQKPCDLSALLGMVDRFCGEG